MNMAALWKLPVIYVCENNMYNEYTHFSETAAGDILARGPAFGVHSESVDGQDVRAVYAVAKRLVERARRGEGPAFLMVQHLSLHGTPRGRYQPRILSLEAGRADLEGRARSDQGVDAT